MARLRREKKLMEACNRIKEHSKDPKYMQALNDFIRSTSS